MSQPSPVLREIFADAAEIPDPGARAAFVERACQGDPALRRRVERLLEADSNAGNFLTGTRDADPAERLTEKPGDQIGHYRLVKLLGRGGGGEVYLAEQIEPVRRQVALKILKLGMNTRSVVARFEAERQTLARMEHPNIARVFDAGATSAGRPYFVMEFVEGRKLTEHCHERQLSVPQRLELFIQICQAVQHAHQKGIVHRDLKPSNILVTEMEGGPVPKVIDFGIAKATDAGDDADTLLTRTSQFLGTPAYMSPEQVEFGAHDVDTRSDIYSLGVILYELLTGQPPFDPRALAHSGLEEMRRIIREVDPPRPSTTITRNLRTARTAPAISRAQAAAVPGDLDWIVMKCLEKDRRRRYETVSALALDLRHYLDDEPVTARPPSAAYLFQKMVRRHRLAFASAAVVMVALLFAVLVSRRQAVRALRAERIAEAQARESRQRLAHRYLAEADRLTGEQRPLLALPWLVEALRTESDPERITDGRVRVALELDAAPDLKLHQSHGGWTECLALSPDRRWLATGSEDGVLRLADVTSGGLVFTNLSLPATVRTVRFSPDGGRLVAVDREGAARLWNVTNGLPLTPLLRASDADPQSVHKWVGRLFPTAEFSPDGRSMLLAWGSHRAQLRDAFTGEITREFGTSNLVWHATFNADASRVVTSGDDGRVQVWDTTTGNSAAPPLVHNGSVAWSQFSPDGKRLLTVCDRLRAQVWDWRSGKRIGPEIPAVKVFFQATFSPDGKSFLLVNWSGVAHLRETDTGRMLGEFQHDAGLVDAQFSPDGRYFVTACHDGHAWVWRPQDAHAPVALLPMGDLADRVVFSADGKLVAAGGRSGRARVWEVFPEKKLLRRFATTDGRWVEFDPAAERFVVAGGIKQADVRVYAVASGKRLVNVRLPGPSASEARFSPDGARLLVAAGNYVHVLHAEDGRAALPPLPHRSPVVGVHWAPDGTSFFTATAADGVQSWDITSGRRTAEFTDSGRVVAMALSTDGSKLATGHDDHAVRLWEARSQRPLHPPWQTQGDVRKLAFPGDGRSVAFASSSADGSSELHLHDVATGKALTTLRQRNELNDFNFSADGRRVVMGGEDRTARVWDATTGAAVSPLLIHPFALQHVNLSPDGRHVVTLGTRGFVRLWTAGGEPLTPFYDLTRDDGSYHAQFSPDGRRLLFTTGAKSAWILELTPDPAPLAELQSRARALSAAQVDPAGGLAPLENAELDAAWQEYLAARARRSGR